jgi:hypothetical protein
MATDRSPIAYIWPTLKAFATGDVITRELLRDSINKAGDIGYGVLAALNERFQQLGSTNAGTSAVQRGTVVMGTLAFYDPVDVPVGSLDGLTLILETDLAGPVTVTFAQPTSPVHVATQINTQGAVLGLVASCDTGVDPNTGAIVAANVGKLLLVRPSGASADLIVKGAGTANAILGLPLVDTTVSGAGTVNDGASRIGLGAFGSWAGGTLQSYLQTVVAAAVLSVATKVAKAGDTMTGDLTFAATKRVKYSDSTTRPARGQWVLSTGATDLSIATGGGILAQTNTAQAVVSADYEFYPITGDTITGIKIAADYNGVPHGGEPGTKPTITLYKWPVGDATPTIVSGPVTDPETVASDYENPHEVAITGASEVVNDTTKYFLRFTSEDGANQEAGYRVTHVLLTTTSSGLPPGL